MRVKSGIWVEAYRRRCSTQGLAVYIARRGDSDAGAIFIKVDNLNGGTVVFGPAVGMMTMDVTLDGQDRKWTRLTGPDPVDEEVADQMIERQIKFDPDIWVIVVEDRTGNAQLDQDLISDS